MLFILTHHSLTTIKPMNINHAQEDMRTSYIGGGTGVIISGLVWLTGGIVAMNSSTMTSLITFFVAGMFIYPLGVVTSKLMGRSGKHKKENQLGKLALASTFILFIGLYLAYTYYQTEPNWFYPIMLAVIGIRYLIFERIYGLKIYWIFGITLIGLGIFSFLSIEQFYLPAILGGITELVFGSYITFTDKKIKT